MADARDIASALGSLAERLDAVDLPAGPTAAGAAALAARARAAADRLVSGVDDLLVVIIGPTGAGKSTLLNALAGRPVSRSGVLRPTTSVPVAWASPRRADRYGRSGIGAAAVDVVRDDHPLTEYLTFVDAPDPDSIATDHRRILEALVSVADLAIVVTTPNRYGDAIPWGLLGSVQRLGSIGYVVMNRIRSDVDGRVQVGHLVARAASAGFDVAADQVVRIPERVGGPTGADVADLSDVLVEIGREDRAPILAHARRGAAAMVAADALAWLDAAGAAAAGEQRLARTVSAAAAAERRTVAEELVADPPGSGAAGPVALRSRTGDHGGSERLLAGIVADLVERFAADPTTVTDLVVDVVGSDVGELLAFATGHADPVAVGRVAAALVPDPQHAPAELPVGLDQALEHLLRLVAVPA